MDGERAQVPSSRPYVGRRVHPGSWFIFDWVVQDVFLCLVELARIVLMLSCVQVSFYFTSRSTKIMALSFTSKKESDKGKQTDNSSYPAGAKTQQVGRLLIVGGSLLVKSLGAATRPCR